MLKAGSEGGVVGSKLEIREMSSNPSRHYYIPLRANNLAQCILIFLVLVMGLINMTCISKVIIIYK